MVEGYGALLCVPTTIIYCAGSRAASSRGWKMNAISCPTPHLSFRIGLSLKGEGGHCKAAKSSLEKEMEHPGESGSFLPGEHTPWALRAIL